MNGAEKLVNIAFVVSICVIIGMALSFAILFYLYGRYKIKNIKNGHEDDDLKKTLAKRYKAIWDKPRAPIQTPIKENTYKEIGNEPSYMKTYSLIPAKIMEQNIENDSIFDNVLIDKRKSKKTNWILNIIFGILYVGLISFFTAALIFRINDEQFYFNDTTLLTIQTGSMEKRNETNTYLKDNNLNNQIEQFSLIGIEKIEDPKELKLYDIIAFKHDDIIIVHRVIRIYENVDNGITYITTRGDSNSDSFVWEAAIDFKDVIGKYNGFQNYGLGVLFVYLQSGIGLIALASAFTFLLTYNTTEGKIEKAYEKRVIEVSLRMDEELNSTEIKECEISVQEN